MKIRGIVKHSFGGSASRQGDQPWMLPLVLQPWRDAEGVLRKSLVTTWAHADTMEELERARASAPSVGAIVEVEVEMPERIRGLDGPRADSELLRVGWAPAVDDELPVFDAQTAPRTSVEDAVLGTFHFDERVEWYWCRRPIESMNGTYEVHVTPLEPREPEGDIERVRGEVAWLEENALALRTEVAAQLWPMWDEAWRQPEEADVDRAQFEAALKLSSASFDPDEGPERFTVYLSDGDLFGGHSIEVEIVNRAVVSAHLAG